MEFISRKNIVNYENPGVISRQLLNPDNSQSNKVTITEVHLAQNAKQDRYIHKESEQIWYALKGSGKLLLSDNKKQDFSSGDVVRFEPGDVHGLYNDSAEEFIYISVTAPPINFAYAYKDKK